MADKTIWDYPTLAAADPNDLILMASDEETYNMKVETLKNAMGEAASKPPIVRNGNWWVWSATQNDYVDSGTAATGPAAGFGTVSATIDGNTGTPSVNITTSGSDTAKNIQFAFHNIKGETGTVTPEVQALANAAAQSATNAADSASSASTSQQAAAQSAQEAASTLSSALPKANVYNALDKTVEGFALDARQGKAINDAKLDKANVYNGLDKTASGFALDARKGAALNDSLSATQSSIAIIVDGDTVTTTIAEGQYVYIKGSTVLADGLYTANSAVPSGTTVATNLFSIVSGGGLNAIQQSMAIEEIDAGTGMAAYKFQGFILLMSVGNGPAIPSTGLPMPAALKPDTYTFATAAVYTNNDWYTQDRWVELRADTGYLAAHNKSAWIDTSYTRFVMIYKAAN